MRVKTKGDFYKEGLDKVFYEGRTRIFFTVGYVSGFPLRSDLDPGFSSRLDLDPGTLSPGPEPSIIVSRRVYLLINFIAVGTPQPTPRAVEP